MPGNLPSERRRSGSSTPGHVRPEGTPPRKSEATQAKTAPARSHSTRGRRQWRCGAGVRPSKTRPPGRDRHDNHRRLPARHGQRRQRVCRGFQGAFSFWGEAAGACSRCCWAAAPAPVCWPNSKWWCSAAPQPRHGRQPTRVLFRRTARPGAETSPGLLAAPEQVGDPAAGGESARRNCAAGGTWRTAPATRTPPRGLPGATEGNHGEATDNGHGRQPTANARRTRTGRPRTGNVPDNVSYFASSNCPTTRQRPAPAIA
jgi:hypothetical protein